MPPETMGDPQAVWVLADAADARRFLALPPPPAARVLALMPAARAVLADTSLAMLDPLARFADGAEARTAVAVRRARRKLVAAVAALSGARAIHREIALDLFARAAYTAYRLWFALGAAGPWMIPENGSWRRRETRAAAHAALLQHMLPPHVVGQAAVGRPSLPPLPGVYRLLRRLLLRAACRERVGFVSGARKGMFGLLDAVAERQSARVAIVQSMGAGWRDYPRLARDAWRCLRGGRFVHAALLAPAADAAMAAAAGKLIASVDDAIIARAFGHYEAMLGERLAQAAPALADAAAVIGAIRPRHYLSPDASRLSDWALAEACGDARVTRWVISRNTHVPATSPLAADACEGYFAARHPDGMVDRYVFWSPHGAAAARAFLPRTRWADIEAVAAIPVAQRFAVETPASAPRKVLVADSYGSWWFTHNWVFQTSDEFLEGLRSLVAVVESLPRTELLVRAKRKRELEGPDYGRLLPAHDNVTVAIRDVPFPRAVAACDLLVAFRSTTIEEAIHARKPVLLWGGTRRYRYLPARTASPSRSDRGVVYAADDADHLARLLPAILDAHAGAPLTDAEIAPHVWPAGTAEISDLARRLVEDHGHRGRGAPAAVAEPLNADA